MASWYDGPLTRIALQLGMVIFASRGLGVLANRMGQPLVVAEISAGILLGPSLLGVLLPAAHQTLFTPESLPVLHMLSQLGLVLFMFLVGLEFEISELRGHMRTSVVVSHAGIMAPFVMGCLLALHLAPRFAEPGVPLYSFALFLGTAMSITAFPVLARILVERGLLQTRVGMLTLACAAVDDVTAWFVLAVVVTTTHAPELGGAALSVAYTVGYVVVMLALGRPLLKRWTQTLRAQDRVTQNVLAVTVMLLFASAVCTEAIGIHALFGAFMFGAILPRDSAFAHALRSKLEDLVVVVLLPLFFAFSGMRMQVGLLGTLDDWLTCGLIVLVACLGKFASSTLSARWIGLNWREAGVLGILMNTRGLMELVVLNIGLDLGIIGPRLFTMMVIMALVTTFMTTPLLNLLYPREHAERDRRALPEASTA